jgi:hypothetical protein
MSDICKFCEQWYYHFVGWANKQDKICPVNLNELHELIVGAWPAMALVQPGHGQPRPWCSRLQPATTLLQLLRGRPRPGRSWPGSPRGWLQLVGAWPLRGLGGSGRPGPWRGRLVGGCGRPGPCPATPGSWEVAARLRRGTTGRGMAERDRSWPVTKPNKKMLNAMEKNFM